MYGGRVLPELRAACAAPYRPAGFLLCVTMVAGMGGHDRSYRTLESGIVGRCHSPLRAKLFDSRSGQLLRPGSWQQQRGGQIRKKYSAKLHPPLPALQLVPAQRREQNSTSAMAAQTGTS